MKTMKRRTFTDDLLREVGAKQNCQIHLTGQYGVPGDYPEPRTDLRTA
jgi:hypothetical protein